MSETHRRVLPQICAWKDLTSDNGGREHTLLLKAEILQIVEEKVLRFNGNIENNHIGTKNLVKQDTSCRENSALDFRDIKMNRVNQGLGVANQSKAGGIDSRLLQCVQQLFIMGGFN